MKKFKKAFREFWIVFKEERLPFITEWLIGAGIFIWLALGAWQFIKIIWSLLKWIF